MTPSRHSYGIVVLFWFLRKNMFCGSVIFGRGLYINCILTMHTNLCGSHEGSSFMSAVCHKECIVCNSLRITYNLYMYMILRKIYEMLSWEAHHLEKKTKQMTTKGIENSVRFTYFENNLNTSKCKLSVNKSIIES